MKNAQESKYNTAPDTHQDLPIPQSIKLPDLPETPSIKFPTLNLNKLKPRDYSNDDLDQIVNME